MKSPITPILLLGIALAPISSHSTATQQDLESAFSKNQWDNVVQYASEMLVKNPNNALAKIKGAYGLFQKGFSNSALLLLKRLSPNDWKTLPQGKDQFVEVVSLFQKKVPLNLLPGRLSQVELSDASPFLYDEIRFAKGREAFERGAFPEAEAQLNAVTKGSRYFGQSRYVVGSIRIKQNDYKTAALEFSKIFEPAVYQQSTEFWKDIGTQNNSGWGTSLQVRIDSDALSESSRLAELTLVGLARIAYATKDFESSLRQYDKVPPQSHFYPEAALERIWTLLALNRNDDAQLAAVQLSLNDNLFESVEARTVRAAILVDSGKVQEARSELDNFNHVFQYDLDGLKQYQKYKVTTALPAFLTHDIQEDARIRQLIQYQDNLRSEVEALRSQDLQIFPVYAGYATRLEPLIAESKTLMEKFNLEHVNRRISDLTRLHVQARLILAETHLEDRERLRAEFSSLKEASEEKQRDHDRRLVKLLTDAINESDGALKENGGRQLNLEFRQSELLWELSTATSILSQTTKDKKDQERADALQKRALQISEDISNHFPTFEKHAQALFFTGFAQLETGRTKDGVAMLTKYTQMYPKHEHVPDAYRILGDLGFESNHFDVAQQMYEKILAFNDSPIVGYALYKLGWCAYNLREFPKALLALEKAINWANTNSKSNQLLSLKREARRDLIAIFAEFGDHTRAFEYFQAYFPHDAKEWLADFAMQLDGTGQYAKSQEIYHTLVLMQPSPEETIRFQTAILTGAFKLGRLTVALDTMREMVDRFKSYLIEPKGDEFPSYGAEKICREIIMSEHFAYQKSEESADIDRILEMDALYRSAFDKWESSEALLYQQAHFLMKRKRIKDSADSFRTHWTKFQATLKEPLREESLRNLIHALEGVESENKTGGANISDTAKEILKYSDDYLRQYSSTKYQRAIAFLHSAMLFKYQKDDEAMVRSQDIFDANMNDDIGKRAFQNLRFAYYNKKDWQKTYEWATSLSERTDKRMETYANDLQAIREETLFLWANTITNDVKSAELFMTISKNPQMKRLREKSLFNAFIHYNRTDKKMIALSIADQLEKTAPTYDNLQDIAGIRAALYQDAGDYVRALPLFETFLKRHEKEITEEVWQQTRLNLGLISEALGKMEKARGYFQEYLSRAPRKDSAGYRQAENALNRIDFKNKRSVASTFPAWDSLIAKKRAFEKDPIPKKGELPKRIQNGAAKLEQTAKLLLDTSASDKTPASFALEAYCAVPFLYSSYSESLLAIGFEKQFATVPELKIELQKLAGPIDAKARELASLCLKQCQEAEHDGPLFRQVNQEWGWEKDKEKVKRVNRLIEHLKMGSPWIEPAPNKKTEREILDIHLAGEGYNETWYSLAKVRYDLGNYGLSRLTFLDALSRKPKSTGPILNAITVIDAKSPTLVGAIDLFERAGKEGSGAAWANAALLHLQGGRLEVGLAAMQQAFGTPICDADSEIKTLVKELMGK